MINCFVVRIIGYKIKAIVALNHNLTGLGIGIVEKNGADVIKPEMRVKTSMYIMICDGENKFIRFGAIIYSAL